MKHVQLSIYLAAALFTACGEGGSARISNRTLPESQGRLGPRFENAVVFTGERTGRSTYDGFASMPDYQDLVRRCFAICEAITGCFQTDQNLNACTSDCVEENLEEHPSCVLPSLDALECLVSSLCRDAQLFVPGEPGFDRGLAVCALELRDVGAVEAQFAPPGESCQVKLF